MKIGISATEPSLEANVEPRFGRCQYFVVVDPDTMQFETVENSSAMAPGGAGISTAQMITGKEVKVVLTGNCGPNAYQVLSSAGIQVVTGVSGKVKDAIESYKSGKLKTSSQPNVSDHFGTGAGSGMGAGMGMGRGKGRGMGMGRGMGFGMTPPVSSVLEPQIPEQEPGAFKAQSQALAQQLSEIQRRIEELEKRDKHSEG
jgi:predicted Fe-Mo cluster-binding NifX family protein